MNTLKIKTVVVAFLLGFSTLVAASNEGPSFDKKEVKTTITKDVQKLLKNSELTLADTEKATVKIMINSKNEIVVLSVDTNNSAVDAFVKRRLNYKKVSTKTASEIFILPIKVLGAR
ncbi:hypothetical protein [uncultured Polaribacter sp.]|uniref:hypothetical protein n=1 Tax=uncultured Polaribacter sp. TaxID=174711 RepID=UPI00260564C1|nr:hypothetical protein [uncultured Polaribacter sp.]